MPKPYRQSFRAPLAAWAYYSSDQRLVGEPLTRDAINEAIEPLQGMPLHIALIEPESELVNVAGKVLLADMV